MSKRESGWYRVKVCGLCITMMEWCAVERLWCIYDANSDQHIYQDSALVECHDEQMVMTPEGELVYHGAEHDPAYNTQQEG